MFDRLKDMFGSDADSSESPRAHAEDELQLAAAALLVEAARMDDDFGVDEHAVIGRLLRERFSLSAEDADRLLGAADRASVDSVELFGFTSKVKDAFDENERVQMIEMLWEVVYADGKVDDHEANLLRRVAGLLYVSDRDSGEARKRVLDRASSAS